MPIRFRCNYCDKLLGIGRRKAGQLVKCPACGQSIQVPDQESIAAEPEPPVLEEYRTAVPIPAAVPVAAGPKAEKKLLGAPLFENADFEELLNPIALGQDEPRPRARGRDLPPPVPLEQRGAARAIDAPPPVPTPRPIGIVISPSRATWLSVGAIFVLVLVFGLGLIVGRMMRPG